MTTYGQIVPNIQPLLIKGLESEIVNETWLQWKRSLEYWFGAADIEDPAKRFNCLMSLGGGELQKIYGSLPQEEIVGSFVRAIPQDPYTVAISRLDEYFSPKFHDLFYRHKFWQVSKEPEDKIDDLVLKIREASSYCKFGKNEMESADGSKAVVLVGKVPIYSLVDSGCPKNIIDDQTWKLMKTQGVQVRNMRVEPNQKFLGYGKSPLKQLMAFDAIIETAEGIKLPDTFYVIENGGHPLLGKETAEKLGILKIVLPSHEGLIPINAVVIEKRPFPKIKGIQIHLPIQKGANPVQMPMRRIPVGIQKAVKTKLDELEIADIVEKVTEYSPWQSVLVPIFKDNGEVRLCVDMRRVNKVVVREKHPLPHFDEILPTLAKAKVFSVLDVKQAFHQVELDEESRKFTTFITPWGSYQYKRLMFGISCAPEMFQRLMEKLLAPCSNVVIFIDDILIYGKDDEEHDWCVRKVMEQLNLHGVLLNGQKCRVKVKEVQFLGHVMNESGIRPSDEKIEAIRKFRAPKSKEELRSLLGLVTYVGKFIPNLAAIAEPLRKLLKKDEKFVWNEATEKALGKIVAIMANCKTLAYFDPSKETVLVTDASDYGLGAVLIQKTTEGERVVSYASKSLTEAEQKYCTTEKEALAIVWAVEKFKMYLLGIHFELNTDHRALEAIFKPASNPPARIERWLLRVQVFDFHVVYKKGNTNIADSLSRLSERDSEEFDEECESYINSIVRSAAVDIAEVERASEADPTLRKLKSAIETRDFSDLDLKIFQHFKDEFCFTGNIILRGHQVIVPESLRPRFLELAHEGHPGEALMKQRLREKCWWPNLERDVKKCVSRCMDCLLVEAPAAPEPMARRALPTAAWQDVAIDFLGPLPGSEYLLVIVDYYSRYLEVVVMKTITAAQTIEKLDCIFTRLGYPRTITLDNAKQFVARSFKDYCVEKGIYLNNVIPYWPQANGQVERQNRTLLKRLKIGYRKTGCWKSELNDFLMMYYTTPHSVTGKTPSELLMNRTIRSKLPSIKDIQNAPNREEVLERDTMAKEKGKMYADRKRRAKSVEICIGDKVLVKKMWKDNKLSTTYDPIPFTVIDRKGPLVTVESSAGVRYQRNVSHMKKVPEMGEDSMDEEEEFYGFDEEEEM